MQILAADQPDSTELSTSLAQVLPIVNVDRIISQPGAPSSPPEEIFGREPQHTWCYYYQKANLARQSGDWATVIALIKEADRHGYEPVKKSEWLLFVDAFVQTGDLAAAEELTSRIQSRDPRLNPLLCAYWSNQTVLPAASDESMLQKLNCNHQASGN